MIVSIIALCRILPFFCLQRAIVQGNTCSKDEWLLPQLYNYILSLPGFVPFYWKATTNMSFKVFINIFLFCMYFFCKNNTEWQKQYRFIFSHHIYFYYKYIFLYYNTLYSYIVYNICIYTYVFNKNQNETLLSPKLS